MIQPSQILPCVFTTLLRRSMCFDSDVKNVSGCISQEVVRLEWCSSIMFVICLECPLALPSKARYATGSDNFCIGLHKGRRVDKHRQRRGGEVSAVGGGEG